MSEKTFKNHLIYTENYFYFHLIEPSEVSVVTEKQRNRSLKLNHALSFDSKYLLKDFIEKEASDENGGVVSWGNSLEKLLEDATGVAAFAEFLKKEFSQENITFWVSCERYKALSDESERKKLATEIFETHLGIRAMEPVNIDAHAHQHTLEKLSEAPVDLFVPAQKQIFNLMKFDSYPRFIKSDLYKECLLRELTNEDIPYSGDIQLASTLQKSIESTPNRGKLKKSRSDAEDSNRKSLLPWHKKNRSKSKDRGEYEYKLSTLAHKRDTEDVVSVRSEITSSRSSLASWDLALRGSFSRQSITSGEISERENCQLCRVILSDGATTVVRVRPKETIQELICRLLEKRGLHYSSFESFIAGSSKPLDLNEDASTLSNKEIHVEQRIVFKLDLPNRRTISVKSKTTKNLGQVLRSVLHKYSYRLEAIAICSVSDNEVLELSLPITAVDGKKLTVLTRSTDTWRNTDSTQGSNVTSNKKFVKPGPTLDEITNKVFEEVLQGKADVALKSDQGSLKSEEWGSEHSSGIFSKFLRRDSVFHDKAKAKSRGATSRLILEGATKHMEGVVSMVTGKPPLIGKWKSSGKLGGKSDSDELYEGLKRAQRNRLEDQRGTEINFELPDFLKDKENTPQSGKKVRKFTREDGTATPKFFDVEPTEDTQQQISQMSAKNTLRNEKNQNNVKSPESSKSNLSTASAKKMDCIGRTISKPLTCKTYETPRTTPIKNDFVSDNGKGSSLFESSERVLSPSKCEPPPLPPKPKYLPSKSIPLNLNHLTNAAPEQITSRGTNVLKPSDIKRDNKLARSRRTMYLDHQSSSFV
ncbi:hypothetical protein RUM44_000770 [Polyplax serrata]|uniref:Regulator of G-protein signaling loco n=1 Tax=Polyplax serrata TaxID=468196 RepID=A0ABR1B8K7_POLSC